MADPARGATIEQVTARAFTVPTDAPESDGTIAWSSTTIVMAEVHAGGVRGLGYSYADAAARDVVVHTLRDLVVGRGAMEVTACWSAMARGVRNAGKPGIASHAISAVDVALWDLKARLLGVPLVVLLGAARDAVPAYGSGGFTSYDDARLREQLGGWVQQGIRAVKMKVGRDPARDVHRVCEAREAIGHEAELFVDANGAYTRKQALAFAERFAESGVSWFEEPVTSDDVEGLRLLRDRAPAGMRIAAGEYAYSLYDARRLLEGGAVDVLQVDGTRCGGISGFLRASALCEAHGVPLSAHTAPSLHAHACCAALAACNVEYFHDHARIERLLFDGATEPVHGLLAPDRTRPGLGLELKEAEARSYEV
jgi:L-alanine-DL-glutamate epimerase-like enolase superfamily enzyme